MLFEDFQLRVSDKFPHIEFTYQQFYNAYYAMSADVFLQYKLNSSVWSFKMFYINGDSLDDVIKKVKDSIN